MPRVTSLAIQETGSPPDGDGRIEVEVRLTLSLLPNGAADVLFLLDGAIDMLWQMLDNPSPPSEERR